MSEARGALGVAALRHHLQTGEVTAGELTRRYLDRIRRVDAGIHAFLQLDPDATRQAEEADRRRADGEDGPLLGIPVAIKDNLVTASLRTTCGSALLDDFVPTRDATVVARLREAGCVILGKTNMDEFGMGSSTESSAFGPTRNPWDLDRVPGGSSGGSAAAVASDLAPLALGSDTGGSVRQPAAFCGVVGLKPTYGRVSRSGLVAFGSSLDQVGPIGRTVEDVATVLECIAGSDPDDMTTSTAEMGNYVDACSLGVEGLRVGIATEYLSSGLDEEIESAVRSAAEVLRDRGATLEEISLPHTRFTIPTYYLIATAEASSNLARYDSVRYGVREEADGLREMYRATRSAGLGREVQRRIMLGTFALSAGYQDQFYGRAQKARTLIRGDFVSRFDEGLDLVLAPTTPTTAFGLGEKVDDPLGMYLSDVYTVTVNLAGLPALSVPIGQDRAGLPIGGQLIGPDFGEETLFRAGAALESGLANVVRTPPGGASA